MAYLYLLLSSACSLLIAHLLKLTELKGLRTLNTLTVNYLIAFVVAFTIGSMQGDTVGFVWPHFSLLGFCLIVGAFFIGNFIAYGKSVHLNGVGVTIAAMRLSLLVPVIVSVYFYREFLGGWKILGILLVFGSLLLLIPRKKGVKFGNIDASWLLLVIFLVTGLADASLKVYNEELSLSLNETLFMGWVLMGAFLIGFVLSIFKQGPLITKQEFKMGAIIGIPNLYSSIFLIYALNSISGAVAFSIVNVVNVLGGTMLGLFFWDDQVSLKQWGGIAIAVTAILLLV